MNNQGTYTAEVIKLKLDTNEKDIKEIKEEVKTLSDFKYTVKALSNTVKDLKVSVDRLTEAKDKPVIDFKSRINNLLFGLLDKSLWLILGAILLSILKTTKF